MRIFAGRTMLAVGLAFFATACGQGGTGDTGGDTNNKVINRLAVPDREFKPADLEATINSLVAEIGKTPIAPMKMAIVLKDLNDFWAPIATGANRAIGELGVSGIVAG